MIHLTSRAVLPALPLFCINILFLGSVSQQLCITAVFCALPLHLSALTRYFFLNANCITTHLRDTPEEGCKLFIQIQIQTPATKFIQSIKYKNLLGFMPRLFKMYIQITYQACQLLSRPITPLFHTIPRHFFAYFLG